MGASRRPVFCVESRAGEMIDERGEKIVGRSVHGQIDPGFARYNRSFGFDRRLFEADVRGSLAHCEGLRAAGVLSDEEAAAVSAGLRRLLAHAEAEGEVFFSDETAEDVHSFIEARLTEMVGDAGRRLHTGRSRNDQVATAPGCGCAARSTLLEAVRACRRRCWTSRSRTRTRSARLHTLAARAARPLRALLPRLLRDVRARPRAPADRGGA